VPETVQFRDLSITDDRATGDPAEADLRSFYLQATFGRYERGRRRGGGAHPGKTEVWIEKYRPERLDDIKGHVDIIPRLQQYIAQNDLPHLMFAGPAGTGKTTAAKAIAREVYGDNWQEYFLELNASDQRGIDVVREQIKDFASTDWSGRKGYKPSIIFLDEADADL